MKQYYTLKLKLTPKQIEMLETILDNGKLSVSDQFQYDYSSAEEKRLRAIEYKMDRALTNSGYSWDWYNNRYSA